MNTTELDYITFERAVDILSHSNLEQKIRTISTSKIFQFCMIRMCVRMMQSLIVIRKWYHISYDAYNPEMLNTVREMLQTLDSNITKYHDEILKNGKTVREIYRDIVSVEKMMNLQYGSTPAPTSAPTSD